VTRLVLIRHGESQAQVDQVIGGERGCKGLSDLGRRQATLLRDRLLSSHELDDVTQVYTSVLPRAIETAALLAPALGERQAQRDCDLCEVHTGDEVDGMTWRDFSEKYPIPADVRYDHYRSWAPGAESWAEFYLRTGRRLRALAADHPDETVVIVCHGGVIRAAMHTFGELPLQTRVGMEPINTSLTEWQLDNEHSYFRWWLVRYNDAAHLAGIS
jgi:2,3-bisphosphoglycerate-dependent phosphoglycerate mutase